MSSSAKCISEKRIQKLFNRGCYLKRFMEGHFRKKKTDDRTPGNLPPGEPQGTRSRIIHCFDENDNRIAVVHLYRRPDGDIGASGKPDPKRLRHKGKEYIAPP